MSERDNKFFCSCLIWFKNIFYLIPQEHYIYIYMFTEWVMEMFYNIIQYCLFQLLSAYFKFDTTKSTKYQLTNDLTELITIVYTGLFFTFYKTKYKFYKMNLLFHLLRKILLLPICILFQNSTCICTTLTYKIYK